MLSAVLFLHQSILKPLMSHRLATIEDALTAIAAGKMIIVVDAEDRENEGTLSVPQKRSRPRSSTL